MLTRLGRFAATHPVRFIIAWVVTAAMLVGVGVTLGPAFTENISAPASESSEGLEILSTQFPSAGGDQGTIVFKADQGVTDPEVQAAMSQMFEAVKQVDGVVNAISPYSPMGGAQIASDGDAPGKIAYAQLIVTSGTTIEEGARIAEEIGAVTPEIDGVQIALGGDMFR